MKTLSENSAILYRTLDGRLQRLIDAALRDDDFPAFVIVQGFRSPALQLKAFETGHSNARPGESPHNYYPALAFDFAPLPVDWKNTTAFGAMATKWKVLALNIGVDITWGGSFRRLADLDHIELTAWRDMGP